MTFRFVQMTDTHTYGPPTGEAREKYLNRELETGCSKDHVINRAGYNIPPGHRFPNPEYDEVLLKFYQECCAHDVDFAVNTGDLITGGATHERLSYWMGLMDKAAKETGVPFYPVRGNHDMNIRHAELTPDEAYEDVCGAGTYWFEHKGWAFLIIDEYYAAYEHGNSYYRLSQENLERIEKLLLEIPRQMPLIYMMHANPIGTSHLYGGETLLHLLRHHNVRMHLFGHVQNNYLSRYMGVPYYTVVGEGAGFDSAPLTYNIVTCRDDGTADCEFVPHTIHIPAYPDPAPYAEGAQAKPEGNWTNLRGPGGDRSCQSALPDHAPALAWRATLPGSLSVGCPNLLGGKVIVGTKSGGRFEECLVRAFGAEDGKALWTREVDASVEGGVLLHESLGFCGTTAGTVYALNLDDGSVAWSWNNEENYPIACEPVLDGETLHLGANWQVYALHAPTGKLVWRKLASDRACSYFCPGHASPLILGERVYHQRTFNASHQDHQSILQAFDKADGGNLEIAHARYTNFPGQRQSSPVRWQDLLLTVGTGLLAFSPDNLQEARFFAENESGSTTPAVAADKAFVSYHQNIVCHDPNAEGKVLWSVPHEPARLHFAGGIGWWEVGKDGKMPAGNYSAPLIAGEKLLVCDTGGHCRCLNAENGAELWRVSVGAPILTAPSVSGNTLFFGDYDGNLYAFAW